MMNLRLKICIAVFILSYCFGCIEEQVSVPSSGKLLAGQWNSYESGMDFLEDGTFKLRRYDVNNDLWIEGDEAIGIFEIKAKTISLINFPGTSDELHLELQLVKLDEKYLWFMHSYFRSKIEHHLKRD